MLRHRKLSIQIWLIFGLTIVLSLLLISLVPWALSDLLEPGVNMAIDRIQLSLLEMYTSREVSLEDLPFTDTATHPFIATTLNHVIFYEDGLEIAERQLPRELISELKERISSIEEGDYTAHSGRLQSADLYYLIRRIETGPDAATAAYLVTYGWDFYRDELVQGIFSRFLLIIGLILLLCLFPAFLLARYIAKPLVQLESHVRQIADRHWHQPIKMDRNDEIGRLAGSIEKMRQQLIQQDHAQQSFLQNISHELKTPVMVIRSYTQSISDGIYPRGDLESTVKVIDEESERLEKRIQDLLFLTKIDYLSTHEPLNKMTNLTAVLEAVIARLKHRRSAVEWALDLSDLEVPGAAEQWTVVFENLLDNQIRYASERLMVSTSLGQKESGETFARVRLWNDGPLIEDQVMEKLFQTFSSGPGGHYGLGLSIVQRLVQLYCGRVWAQNEAGGVAFYVEIPGAKSNSVGQEEQ